MCRINFTIIGFVFAKGDFADLEAKEVFNFCVWGMFLAPPPRQRRYSPYKQGESAFRVKYPAW